MLIVAGENPRPWLLVTALHTSMKSDSDPITVITNQAHVFYKQNKHWLIS